MYKVKFSRKADKEFRRFSKKTQANIKKAVKEKLSVDPRFHTKPLKGKYQGYNRFRVGSYRLICEIKDKELVVLVVKANHRGKAYKD